MKLRTKHTYNLYLVLLLTMALLLNAAAPLFVTLSNSYASNQAEAGNFPSDKILICTSTGFKYISIEDFENGDYPQDNNFKPHCPLCIVNNGIIDDFVPSSTTVDFLQLSQAKIQYQQFTQHISSYQLADFKQPRAPPHSL